MKDILKATQFDSDPFGLKAHDWKVRLPEKSEMFIDGEAQIYIDGCDYPETADDFLLAIEIQRLLGNDAIRNMRILDAMCGPGRLGRELIMLDAQNVTFHDGDQTMVTHAQNQASLTAQGEQSVNSIQSLIDKIPTPDNTFDLVVCHNSTHQMASIEKLKDAMGELVRVTTPQGRIIIADYQRHESTEFLESLKKRLDFTKEEIIDLLLPSFYAAFTKDEFADVVDSIPGVRWSIFDAPIPILSPEQQARVNRDHVLGHLMDYSPISLRVIIQKEK